MDDDWALSGDDDIVFKDEGADADAGKEERPWRVLIVDDEQDIHAVTHLALKDIRYKGRGLELLSAFSGAEAFAVLERERDIAMILLDVVMESDDSGLRLVERIRDELGNRLVRIVLRTGQPGQAPEQKVIVDYDINDYKMKTELTVQRLFTTVIASLRAYEGLLSIECNRIGLTRILKSSSNLYELKSLREFANGVLSQIGAILDVGADGVLCVVRSAELTAGGELAPVVMAATGSYSTLEASTRLPADYPWLPIVQKALREKSSQFVHPANVLYIHTTQGHEFAVLMTPQWPLEPMQRDLLALFCDRIASAFDSLHLNQKLQKAQEASVMALADLAESRDTDTGGHVHRVCRLTQEIARELKRRDDFPDDLTAEFLDMVGVASILHDVGKVATPDAVLLKPGGHDPAERQIMENHALAGEKVLRRAALMVEGVSYLTYGAQIAGGHHENYDGSGYPRRLKGDEIPLAARIVAVVDVFDALLHRRPYKEPWPLSEALAFVVGQSGRKFDPRVVDALVHFIEAETPDWIIGDGH